MMSRGADQTATPTTHAVLEFWRWFHALTWLSSAHRFCARGGRLWTTLLLLTRFRCGWFGRLRHQQWQVVYLSAVRTIGILSSTPSVPRLADVFDYEQLALRVKSLLTLCMPSASRNDSCIKRE